MLCNPLSTHTVTLRAQDKELGRFRATLQPKRAAIWASPDVLASHQSFSVLLGNRELSKVTIDQCKCSRAFYLSPDCIEIPLTQ